MPSSLLAGRQGRLVLAYLVCSGDRPVPREELAEVLWGDEVPESWPASLSAVVSRLRKLLTEVGLDGQKALTSTPTGYRLALPDDTWVDWWAAHVAIERAEKAVEARDADEASAAATEAASIVERGFLTDDCEWVDRQREAAHDISFRAARVDVEAGDFFTAVPPGGDLYLLANVLWNWPEADALRILERCRDAMAPTARLVICEPVVPVGNDPHPAKVLDLANFWINGGCTRTAREWNDFLEEAGFRLTGTTETELGWSVVEACRA